ncbi:hypothetical protein Fbal_1586 [Ferrimonas balearica DSM 9799]|uniref:Tyr recombinase domain-containing protein n=1 Tax=Ferrimonas balearica (strain DSM 9799 / CCM 4581 / KCTC 23876 / PAT) TaxID=550540 RepID=E1SPZ5_FERBD|nr:site-specific integrase [Ferrimonas balearica]ADN75790.1 hypothetical protein Fbal_1586 [Ferrimonas balearica DSM 9799]
MPVRYVKLDGFRVNATPHFKVSKYGEPRIEWADDGQVLDGLIQLFDSNDRPINCANRYLIYCMTVDRAKDLGTKAKALMHFFTFLEDHGLQWDHMPRPRNLRPLYRFRDYLQALHDQVLDPETNKRSLASSTAKAYIGAVTAMYVYWLGHGKVFFRDPCRFRVIKVKDERMLGHINGSIKVLSNDLKIDAKDKKERHLMPSKLRPLKQTEAEPDLDVLFQALEQGRGYAKENGVYKQTAISMETRLGVMLSLYTGMRIGEVLSFSSELVRFPKPGELAIEISIGPGVCCDTKNGTTGVIKIPAWLMRQLAIYKHSQRYRTRLAEFNSKNTDDKHKLRYPPLLLNRDGVKYEGGSFNARWGEIRRAIHLDFGLTSFKHKFHNLRATYAVNLLTALLAATHPMDHPKFPGEPMFTRDQALAEVQARLRHSSLDTTSLYLKHWDDENLGRKADRIHEQELDAIYGASEFIGVTDDILAELA